MKKKKSANKLIELMRHIDIPILFTIDRSPLDNLVDILDEVGLAKKKFLIIHGAKSSEEITRKFTAPLECSKRLRAFSNSIEEVKRLERE
ncbi:MAG: hypothetical protein JSV97_09355, partial [candidate division WOR-3 bacterium]